MYRVLRGVSDVVSGYTGGATPNPSYEAVCTGATGHAEAIAVTFDPEVIPASVILDVFFTLHDPTQLNRQGPDSGSQYRSVIFYTSDEQRRIVQDYIRQLTAAHTFSDPIVTQVVTLQQFYPAEAHHQNYLALHPYQPYIMFNDMPKLEHLREQFPALYQ